MSFRETLPPLTSRIDTECTYTCRWTEMNTTILKYYNYHLLPIFVLLFGVYLHLIQRSNTLHNMDQLIQINGVILKSRYMYMYAKSYICNNMHLLQGVSLFLISNLLYAWGLGKWREAITIILCTYDSPHHVIVLCSSVTPCVSALHCRALTC